jgi:hypothetical protein
MPDVSLDAIPEDFQQFSGRLESLCEHPEGAAAGVILALAVLAMDRQLGRQCVQAAAPSLPASRFRFVEERLAGNEYLPRSYFLGTRPENGYQHGELPIVMRFSTNPYSGDPAQGRVKLFVECSGADSPRPITVERNDSGQWRAVEWSSLLSGIRPPAPS